MNTKRRGFTLIELLVVVAIIAVLMAILLPSLSTAKNQAKRVQCAAKLRDWGQVVHTYTAEYDNQFFIYYNDTSMANSAGKTWWFTQNNTGVSRGYDAIWSKDGGSAQSRIATILKMRDCPASVTDSADWRDHVTYVMTYFRDDPESKVNSSVWKMSSFTHPSTSMLMMDGEFGLMYGNAVYASYFSSDSAVNLATATNGRFKLSLQDLMQSRHQGQWNAAFVDGHVETIKWSTLTANSPSVWTAPSPVSERSKIWTFRAVN